MKSLVIALACIAPLCGTTVTLAQAPAPEYTIRESEPRTGSNIRRAVVRGSPIPINKKYEELSAEQKDSLNQFYESMGPGDEPPFPADGLKPIHHAMAKAQQKFLVSGDLMLIAAVASDGNVTQVKAIGSPSPEMTKFASTVLLLTKFKPALCKGAPCTMDYPFHFKFQLE